MRAAQMAAMEHMTGDVYRVGCDLERELNAANERIQRLEEAGDGMRIWITVIRGYLPECTNIWRKAKEAKP
jgi:hypothetical protein